MRNLLLSLAILGALLQVYAELARQPRPAVEIAFEKPVPRVTFSPDGRRLACGALEGVQVFDARTGKAISPVLSEPKQVQDVEFCGNGLLYVHGDYGVVLYDTSAWQPVFRRIEGTPAAGIDPTGRILLVGENNVERGRCESYVIQGYRDGQPFYRDSGEGVCIDVLRLAPTGDRYLSQWRNRSGRGSAVRGWGLRDFAGRGVWLGLGAARFDPTGERIAFWSREDQSLSVRDGRTGQRLVGPIASGGVQPGQYSPNGRLILTTGETADGTQGLARVWSAENLKPVSEVRFGRRLYSQFATRDDVVSYTSDGTVFLWDSRSGKARCQPWQAMKSLLDVSVAADGRIAVGGSDETAEPRRGVVRIFHP
ncbi:MAG: WD40 repeat domain-containing protein [Armatimonadetes bacterium]|nr:WD40 repeat domain-containing protein [Armatimonadota bacterium]